MEYCALVAQLAEHIHGKDKVISSILIEGYAFAGAKQEASQRRFARQIEGFCRDKTKGKSAA